MTKLRTRFVALLSLAVAAGCARHTGGVASLVIGRVPLFETRIEIPTGSSIHADYHIADYNLDGRPDMAVISLTGELRVLFGNGAGFDVVQDEQIGGLPIWMSGGDFDNDGDQDLVIVRSDAGSTDLWRNDNGSFTQAGSIAAGSNALAVVVGDLNNDGNLDVAVSRPGTPDILVGFGDGAMDFAGTQEVPLPGGGIAFNLAVADADRDGELDLMVADTGNDRIVIFKGFALQQEGTTLDYCQLSVPGVPAAIAVGDLSGDGLGDFVVSAFGTNHYVVITEILPPGKGPECDYVSFDVPIPGRPGLCAVADVTGDGVDDIVGCLAFDASIVIVPGLQGGGVGDLETLDSSGMPLRPFVGDFDGNGRNDIFALAGAGNRVNLWLARNSGAIAGARSYPSGLAGASWVESGDFDGDGDTELLVGCDLDTRLTILGGVGGVLVQEGTIEIGDTIHQLRAGDIDVDGKLDVVVGVPGGIKVLRNESTPGNYSFGVLPDVSTAIGSSDFPFGIAIADLDRDGDNDLAVCDYLGGGVHILPGTAQPFVFGTEVVVNVGGGPVDVARGDFTGDGLLDLAVSRVDQSDIVVLRNLGNLQFTEFLAVPVGQSPNYLVTEDFNRDGRADLVVSNAESGTVSVLFGGANGFSGEEYAAGAAPTALMARDLTGDGFVDILVTSLQSGDFRVLVGDGRGSFPLLPAFPGTFGASDAALADMNQDGLPDLVVASLVTDRISLVRNISELQDGVQ
ncbi:MAG: VCBS repeat-containing protein [Planctomycetes bacterium]|nr:VCBS repeat-containing protein [Planctomycetota bacterium]